MPESSVSNIRSTLSGGLDLLEVYVVARDEAFRVSQEVSKELDAAQAKANTAIDRASKAFDAAKSKAVAEFEKSRSDLQAKNNEAEAVAQKALQAVEEHQTKTGVNLLNLLKPSGASQVRL